jgi:hypothetical protein
MSLFGREDSSLVVEPVCLLASAWCCLVERSLLGELGRCTEMPWLLDLSGRRNRRADFVVAEVMVETLSTKQECQTRHAIDC